MAVAVGTSAVVGSESGEAGRISAGNRARARVMVAIARLLIILQLVHMAVGGWCRGE